MLTDPPPPHAEPLATWLPLASILTQSPEVCAPVVVTNAVVFPERVPTAGADASAAADDRKVRRESTRRRQRAARGVSQDAAAGARRDPATAIGDRKNAGHARCKRQPRGTRQGERRRRPSSAVEQNRCPGAPDIDPEGGKNARAGTRKVADRVSASIRQGARRRGPEHWGREDRAGQGLVAEASQNQPASPACPSCRQRYSVVLPVTVNAVVKEPLKVSAPPMATELPPIFATVAAAEPEAGAGGDIAGQLVDPSCPAGCCGDRAVGGAGRRGAVAFDGAKPCCRGGSR
jgi:hypothetical protein